MKRLAIAVIAVSALLAPTAAQASTHPRQDMVRQTTTCMTHAGASVIRKPNGAKARWGTRWIEWQAFADDGTRVLALMTSSHNLSHRQEHRANLCLRPFGGSA